MPEINNLSVSEDDGNLSDVDMEATSRNEEAHSDEEISDADEDDSQSEEQEVVHRNIYVQFPGKRPDNAEEALQKVSDKIKYIRFPRQKKARFCYVHCETEDDAIEVETKLRTTEVCGFRLFVNRKRKIDDPEFRQKLKNKQIEKKIAKRDAKRLKKQLKQKAVKKVSKVNKIVVSNIPNSVSVEELKQIFRISVEFQYREKPNRIAFVTFSTAEEATKFIKKHPKIGDHELAVRPMLVVNRKKKQVRRRRSKGQDSTAGMVKKGEKQIEMLKLEKTKDKLKTKIVDKGIKKQKDKNSKINYVTLKKSIG